MPGEIKLVNFSNSSALYRYCSKNDLGKIYTTNIELSGLKSTVLSFGFDHYWTEAKIKEYLASVSRIELITKTDTITLSDKSEMFNYFKIRRKGIFKKTIIITLE